MFSEVEKWVLYCRVPANYVRLWYKVVLSHQISCCCPSTKILLFQQLSCFIPHQQGSKSSGESKHFIERDGYKISWVLLQVQWWAANKTRSIQQNIPSTSVLTCWVKLLTLNPSHIAQWIFPPRKIALGRITEKMCHQAFILYIYCGLISFGSCFYFLRIDRHCSHSLRSNYPPNAHYWCVIVREVTELTSWMFIRSTHPRKRVSH